MRAFPSFFVLRVYKNTTSLRYVIASCSLTKQSPIRDGDCFVEKCILLAMTEVIDLQTLIRYPASIMAATLRIITIMAGGTNSLINSGWMTLAARGSAVSNAASTILRRRLWMR